ncbi:MULTISPECIES: hypothetical protein [unclassified Pseudomonas]|uniref:hypothetical protein n=1 Tax=unclassified Pseudomonas TaxID=196821 RepID=UPI002AC9DCE8|nr:MULTISPECIES: hypothetical protein [unclassified Pseudomonas]MEB0040888.1 hypothetical protein [Pseudomonas sp. MH10]MEB0079566.1 hypothetical protein [Pseudomonas sp. MH10out]MEB0102663.1 hypothetical protein [Pseudomonas sp. CCI3.2]MEB0119451.1 hypothetical protein [Pseudomonas sp. CCI1.2]MEB0132537.1 hypothetical protein [Pseudomonas sp. CCI2.4]
MIDSTARLILYSRCTRTPMHGIFDGSDGITSAFSSRRLTVQSPIETRRQAHPSRQTLAHTLLMTRKNPPATE